MAQQTKRRIIDQRDLSDHEKKNLLILEVIRRKGPIARAEVARLVNLNNVTVTSYVDQYLRKHILQEAGVHISTGGRKPTLVDIDPTISFAIGVGLTAITLNAVLCDLKGKVIHRVTMKATSEIRSNLAEKILEVIDILIRESNVDVSKLHGVGVGVPGIVNQNEGTVRWPRGLLTGDLSVQASISNMIYDRFDLPVILDNDANTAVFAEQWTSPNGLDVHSAVYLYSGSGCGLLLNGNIYRGSTGSAGEVLFDMQHEDPIAWLKESIESGDWVIDLGITKRAREEIAKHQNSKIYEACGGDPSQIHIDTVVNAAKQNDAFAVTLLTDAGKALGRRAAVIVNLVNPELLIIGGGVETAGIIFMDAVRDSIKQTAIKEASEKLRLVPSHLGEDAVPIGAAALVIQNFFITN